MQYRLGDSMKIPKVIKSTEYVVNEVTDGSAKFKGDNGDVTLHWKLNPDVNLPDLKDGDYLNAVAKSSASFEIDKHFTDTDVDIAVKVGANVGYFIKSPSGTASASFTATMHF
jgi:hypothetical protein